MSIQIAEDWRTVAVVDLKADMLTSAIQLPQVGLGILYELLRNKV